MARGGGISAEVWGRSLEKMVRDWDWGDAFADTEHIEHLYSHPRLSGEEPVGREGWGYTLVDPYEGPHRIEFTPVKDE